MRRNVLGSLASLSKRSFNYMASVYEAKVAPACDADFVYAPIFIIGPPRSGSTLLMQAMTDAFDVGYLSNVHSAWYGFPALAEQQFQPLRQKAPSDFNSAYGRTAQRYAPAECGAWWYRFFPKHPAYVSGEQADAEKMKAFRRSLLALEAAFAKPVIFKNLYASLRIEPIRRYVPEAVFIVVERDRYANAASILKGRKDALGVYDQWWSVPWPAEASLQLKSPAEQVLAQIDGIHSLIDAQLSDSDRVFRVDYDAFCRASHGVLDRFALFMQGLGVELEPRFDIPNHFPPKAPASLPDHIRNDLLKRLGSDAAPPVGDEGC